MNKKVTKISIYEKDIIEMKKNYYDIDYNIDL